MSNNNENYELDYYISIIEFFQNQDTNEETTEIWKNKSIIELMKFLEGSQNRTLVTNALILILSLFEDIPPDIYNNRGVNINRISQKDKRFLIEDLKEEFLPN